MTQHHNTGTADFQKFMKQRSAAARAYVTGDAAPLNELLTAASPASFFGPQGDVTQGASDVAASYAKGAEAFSPQGESHLEILQMGASGDIGFWVGVQHAKVRLRDRKEVVTMDLRVTEIFRREEGEWKLVHRHADNLKR